MTRSGGVSPHRFAALARRLAALFAGLAEVQAVGLGGSQRSGAADAASDIDLYVFSAVEIPLARRREIVERSGGAARADLGLTYWGPGDEWMHAPSGIEVDIVYFEPAWIEAQLRRVIDEHQASLGYSTCFWYTMRRMQPLYDPSGWLGRLIQQSQAEYPEALRRNIIALNYPVLRGVIPAYQGQIAKAIQRGDLVSVNHRLAAFFTSYFDILFAVNRQLHPGEKRLAQAAMACCRNLPQAMEADIAAILAAGAAGDPQTVVHLDRLLDRLDEVMAIDRLI